MAINPADIVYRVGLEGTGLDDLLQVDELVTKLTTKSNIEIVPKYSSKSVKDARKELTEVVKLNDKMLKMSQMETRETVKKDSVQKRTHDRADVNRKREMMADSRKEAHVKRIGILSRITGIGGGAIGHAGGVLTGTAAGGVAGTVGGGAAGNIAGGAVGALGKAGIIGAVVAAIGGLVYAAKNKSDQYRSRYSGVMDRQIDYKHNLRYIRQRTGDRKYGQNFFTNLSPDEATSTAAAYTKRFGMASGSVQEKLNSMMSYDPHLAKQVVGGDFSGLAANNPRNFILGNIASGLSSSYWGKHLGLANPIIDAMLPSGSKDNIDTVNTLTDIEQTRKREELKMDENILYGDKKGSDGLRVIDAQRAEQIKKLDALNIALEKLKITIEEKAFKGVTESSKIMTSILSGDLDAVKKEIVAALKQQTEDMKNAGFIPQ